MKEAYLFEKKEENKVQCNLCNHRCIIEEGKRGICGVRENRGGTLFSLVYEKAIASHIDPIEKKPLFHFYPGSTSYSIATVGCNFKCLFCQNADISQMPHDQDRIMGQYLSSEEIVNEASSHGCRSISYTYTEPTIYFEYAYDTAKRASKRDIKNIFVSNGYMTKEALDFIAPYLDGANIDLKSFRDEFYKKFCKARISFVLDTIKNMKEKGIWIEVTTLIIPGLNDSEEELRDIAKFLYSIDPAIPWHVSRFQPTYRLLDRPPTPPSTLKKARDIGLSEGLYYVYTGNIPGDEGENTFCHNCNHLLIERFGFSIMTNNLTNGKCPNCGTRMYGVL